MTHSIWTDAFNQAIGEGKSRRDAQVVADQAMFDAPELIWDVKGTIHDLTTDREETMEMVVCAIDEQIATLRLYGHMLDEVAKSDPNGDWWALPGSFSANLHVAETHEDTKRYMYHRKPGQ